MRMTSINDVYAIRTTQSKAEKHEINAKQAANDTSLLADIGYKQELRRSFKTYQIFGISYSVMIILSGVASMTGIGLGAGPSGYIWSWFIAMHFIYTIGISMSELASAIPTSGGLYFWTHYYAPEKYRVFISYIIGLSNSMALCSTCVSATYTVSLQIQAAIFIHTDGSFVITNGKTYGIFAALLISAATCTCLSSGSLATLQNISGCFSTFMVILFFIALPTGNKVNDIPFNDRKFIFGTIQNWSDWPTGWNFCLCMMACVWSIGAFDSCVHMSEEAQNASYGVPVGIISSTTVVGYVCWFCVICLMACMSNDVESILGSETGFPFAQVIYESLGKDWAVAMMALIATSQWIGCTSILAALSRQIWAFARDDGLPFSSIVKVVNPKLKVPIRAIIFAACVGLLIGCLCLAGSAASNALFSLSVSGNYISWISPIFLRLTSGRKRFTPGKFYLGDFWSPVVGWIGVIWGAFVLVICMFPSHKAVNETDMNYTVVITCGVWILSALYYWLYKRKYYRGPKSNLSPDAILAMEAEVINQEVVEITEIAKDKNYREITGL